MLTLRRCRIQSAFLILLPVAMHHRRLVYSGVLATVAAASTVFCQPNRTAATAAEHSSTTPAQQQSQSAMLTSPLFQRPPGPVSISLPPTLPPRPHHLHPLLAVCIVRHGARTPVMYLEGQSPDEFAQLWGQCHAIDAEAGKEIDPGAAGGRESESPPEQLAQSQGAADENTTLPCARGQLTQTGEMQLREVGAMLRRQYVEHDQLLPPSFAPSVIAIRSSNITRTRLSAVRLVQGLYPGTPLATIRALISVKPERDEDLYPMYKYNPRLRELFHTTLHHDLYQKHLGNEEVASFYQQADRLLVSAPFQPQQQQPREVSGRKRSWIALSDELKCRQGEGLAFPAGVDEQLAARINRCAEFLFHSLLKAGEHDTEDREAEVTAMLNDRHSVYNENARLGIGRFIQSGLQPIFQRLTTKPTTSSPRLHVIAAHDSSVVAIMNALGFDASLKGEWPPFASYIVMEVLADERSESSRFVRVVYNGELVDMVDFEEWMRRLQNVRVDYEKECKAHGDGEVPPQYW